MLPESVDEFVSLFWRGTERDRDVARWRVATLVIAHLGDDYRVERTVRSEEGEVLDRSCVDYLRNLERSEILETLSRDKSAAKSFGAWRHAVALLEANNARRLLVLGDTVKFLSEIRERSSDTEVVDRLLYALAEWLASEWRTDVPLAGDLRTWAIRQTRLYDLCPPGWRHLWIN